MRHKLRRSGGSCKSDLDLLDERIIGFFSFPLEGEGWDEGACYLFPLTLSLPLRGRERTIRCRYAPRNDSVASVLSPESLPRPMKWGEGKRAIGECG